MKDVDGEVLQNLKRLGRKDPTTKVRLLVILFSFTFIFLKKYCTSSTCVLIVRIFS